MVLPEKIEAWFSGLKGPKKRLKVHIFQGQLSCEVDKPEQKIKSFLFRPLLDPNSRYTIKNLFSSIKGTIYKFKSPTERCARASLCEEN